MEDLEERFARFRCIWARQDIEVASEPVLDLMCCKKPLAHPFLDLVQDIATSTERREPS